jgi:ureidoacrylate peracid hydrolase
MKIKSHSALLLLIALSITNNASYGQAKVNNAQPISLPARPAPIGMDVATTAIIVVDMQNDFGSKGGMMDRAGINISPIQKAIAPTAKVLAGARQAGIKIIYLKMGYKPDLSDLGSEDAPNRLLHLQIHVGDTMNAPNGTKGRILIRDTWGTDIVDELKPAAGDIVLYKTRYSGFYNTDLDGTLKKMGIRKLIFTGCTTSVCVESTIRDAMFRDYSPILLEDCAAEPTGYEFERSNHDATILTIEQNFGWISDSDKFLKSITTLPKARAGK